MVSYQKYSRFSALQRLFYPTTLGDSSCPVKSLSDSGRLWATQWFELGLDFPESLGVAKLEFRLLEIDWERQIQTPPIITLF